MKTREDVVDTLEHLIASHETDYATVSRAIGRNHSYIQQFIKRGTPRELPEEARYKLAIFFNTSESRFKTSPTPAKNVGLVADEYIQDVQTRSVAPIEIIEIDAKGGAGGGGMSAPENVGYLNEKTGQIEGVDGVVDTWSMPAYYAKSALKINPADARIIEILGDSMEPKLCTGDRVLVDIADRSPSPPGIFALWDSYGIVVKSVERVHGADPAKIRVISNNPIYSPYELTEDEANIIGRVKWVGRAL